MKNSDSKMFTNQIKEIRNSVETSKKVSTSSDVQTENAAKREKLGAKIQTPREIWAKFERENALLIAAKVVAKSGFSYSFDDAKEVTKDFSLILTTSEDAKPFETIGTKSIYCKEIEPISVDLVLRSFESCKLHFDAIRIETNKKQRFEANREKSIKQMQNSKDLLFEAMALTLGVSVEDLKALQK